MSKRIVMWGGCVAVMMMALPVAAQAQEVATPPDGSDVVEVNVGPSQGFRLDVAAGVKGGLTGAWALEVPENSAGAIDQQTKSYYSQFGLGGDVGLALDIRALGLVGLETGFRVSFDNGDGYNELTEAGSDKILVRINQYQRTTSLRLPLLLKVGKPDGLIRPTAAFGVEFVRQTQSSIRYEVEEVSAKEAGNTTAMREARNQIETSTYPLATFALGIEVDAGPVKIPIELRAQYNLKYGGNSFDERVRFDQGSGEKVYYYNGAYQGHFGITVGLLYDHTFYIGQ